MAAMNDLPQNISQMYETTDLATANRYANAGWEWVSVMQYADREQGMPLARALYVLAWTATGSKPVHPPQPNPFSRP
jgi:hypothetical protein